MVGAVGFWWSSGTRTNPQRACVWPAGQCARMIAGGGATSGASSMERWYVVAPGLATTTYPSQETLNRPQATAHLASVPFGHGSDLKRPARPDARSQTPCRTRQGRPGRRRGRRIRGRDACDPQHRIRPLPALGNTADSPPAVRQHGAADLAAVGFHRSAPVGAPSGEHQPVVSAPLLRFRAMGCDVRVAGATAAQARRIHALFDRHERRFSRFVDGSELNAVNAGAGRAIRVSRTFADMLELSLWAARETGGLVDPTIGSALRAAGYDRDFGAGLDRPEPPGPAVAGCWHRIEARDQLLRVPAGVELDLNGVVKSRAV